MPLIEERDRKLTERFHDDFPDQANAIAKAVGVVPRDPSDGDNEEQIELLSDVFELHQEAQEQGVIPATLLSMRPWTMRAQGMHHEGIEIPMCPIGQAYIQHVFPTYRIDLGDRWGRFKAKRVTPISLARDWHKQHFGDNQGGLVVYTGNHLPGNRRESREEELSLIERARVMMAAHFEKLYDAAEGFIATDSKNGWRSVSVQHKQATRWLFDAKLIKQLPNWVTERRPKDWVRTDCQKCGAEIESKGYACAKCNHIHNGIKAYQLGEISKENIALKRHSREELDAVGLHDVKTLTEERTAEVPKAETKPAAKKKPETKEAE